MWSLYAEQLSDRHIPKPWEFVEREKELLLVDQKPKPVPGHVGDFNFGNVFSRQRGSHARASG